jgi:hypothetical protein
MSYKSFRCIKKKPRTLLSEIQPKKKFLRTYLLSCNITISLGEKFRDNHFLILFYWVSKTYLKPTEPLVIQDELTKISYIGTKSWVYSALLKV